MTDRETLLIYRLRQAEETLEDAEMMLHVGVSARSIINRAYYAMLYAVLGLFLKMEINLKTSKHSGIISIFDREFILTGKIDKEFSRWLHKLFNSRQEADYKELIEITIAEAKDGLKKAQDFVREMQRVIKKEINQ